jgi:hypothetical protein
MAKFLSTVIISIFIFVLKFNTNHHQIGELQRVSRQTPSSCNLASLTGTTRQLREIFIGRCFYFINVLQKQSCDFDSTKYNCNSIWDTFYNISKKNTQKIADYDPLLALTDQVIPVNTSLFWSGTYTQAHQCKEVLSLGLGNFFLLKFYIFRYKKKPICVTRGHF